MQPDAMDIEKMLGDLTRNFDKPIDIVRDPTLRSAEKCRILRVKKAEAVRLESKIWLASIPVC